MTFVVLYKLKISKLLLTLFKFGNFRFIHNFHNISTYIILETKILHHSFGLYTLNEAISTVHVIQMPTRIGTIPNPNLPTRYTTLLAHLTSPQISTRLEIPFQIQHSDTSDIVVPQLFVYVLLGPIRHKHHAYVNTSTPSARTGIALYRLQHTQEYVVRVLCLTPSHSLTVRSLPVLSIHSSTRIHFSSDGMLFSLSRPR